MDNRVLKDSIFSFVSNEAERLGFFVVDININLFRSYIEVVLDSEKGILLDSCSEFNKILKTYVNAQDSIDRTFVVDVCSPGLDRVIKSDMEFSWVINRQKVVEVFFYDLFDGKSSIVGSILKIDDACCLFKDLDLVEFSFDREKISKVKLSGRLCIGR